MSVEVQSQSAHKHVNLANISEESKQEAIEYCRENKEFLDHLEQFGNDFDRRMARTFKLIAGVE